MFKKYSKDGADNKVTNDKGDEVAMEQYTSQQSKFIANSNQKNLANNVSDNVMPDGHSRFFDQANNSSMNMKEYSSMEEGEYSNGWGDKIAELPVSPSYNNNLFEGEEPETVLGEGVSFKGCLQFKRYLRIDGNFEGELVSEGKLVVGPKGVVKSDVQMHEVIVEGYVEGNITVEERLELRGDAQVHGDITARSLSVDDGVTIVGHVCVKPESLLEIDVSEEEQE